MKPERDRSIVTNHSQKEQVDNKNQMNTYTFYSHLTVGPSNRWSVNLPFLCARCGRCCTLGSVLSAGRSLVGDPSKEEIARINRKLRPFYAGYNRIPYEDEGRRNEYLSKTKCPFLGSDNSCEIYAHRPIGCQAFPKTDGSMDTEEGYCESIDRFRSQLEALLKGLRKYVGDDYFPEDGVKPVKMTKKRYELCVARLLGAGMTCEELACFRYLNRQ